MGFNITNQQEVLTKLMSNEKYDEAKKAIDLFQQLKDYQRGIGRCQKELNQLLVSAGVLEPKPEKASPVSEKEQDTKEDSEKKVVKKKVVETTKQSTGPKTYLFTRKLSGAMVGDTYIKEMDLRKMNVIPKTGDQVVWNDQGELDIITPADHDEGNIIDYDKVIVKYDSILKQYYFDRYANGDKIAEKNGDLDIVIINPEMKVKEGDIVEYAFYNPKSTPIARNAHNGNIRWIYPTTSLTETEERKTIKPVKKIVKNETPKVEHLFDMDLKDKSILIVTALVDAEYKLGTAIKKYDPKEVVIKGDVNSGSPLDYARATEHFDIVIVCTDLIRHSTSQGMMNYLREANNIQYAVANKSSANSVERALYRATHELPAFENSGMLVDYKTITKG